MSSKNVNSFSTIGIIDTYSNSSLLGIVSGNLTRLTSGNLVLNQVNASNLIYNTGNQTISGIKTFASRPTVNGTGVLLSGEASAVVLPTTLVYTTGNQIISGTKTFANNLIVSGSGIFNALDLNNIDVLSLSGIDVNIISGGVSLTNRPTVNGTGVLLQGQNSFIINLYNTSDTQSAGHNYFGNLSVGFDPNINNRRFPVLEACIVKKATWSQFNGTVGSPSLNSTGYFINTTTNVTGIISTTINNQNATTPNHYIADFSPPITISTGDYIACSLFGPNYTITFPATVRNSVNLYCYN